MSVIAARLICSNVVFEKTKMRGRRVGPSAKRPSPSPRLPLLLWAAVPWLCAAHGQQLQEQRFAMEPQDQTAVVGSRVTLPCRVLHKTGILQWTKDDFGLGTHRNLSGFERYAMVGSDEEGDYSLDIYPVLLEDDARYQCQVSPGPQGQPGIRSRFAALSVLVAPEAPRITQGGRLATTEDREIELECVSAAGKPPAEITWIDGLGNVLADGIENIVDKLPDNRRFTARSILKLTPRKEHHNTTFTCQAQNTAERTHRSARLRLEVKYAPKVSVTVAGGGGGGGGGRVPEGGDVRLACAADANPADVQFRWFLNDEPLAGDFERELVLRNVSRRHHDAIVKCEAHNAVGKSEDSLTLDVAYGPRFRARPQPVQAEAGAAVTLQCDVDGNPAPEVAWFRAGRARPLAAGPNLTVRADAAAAGAYECRARVPGFPEVAAEAAVYLRGPPAIVSARTQWGLEGDTVRVECAAHAVPRPERALWLAAGRPLDPARDHVSILEEPLPDGLKSTLVIRDSRADHFATYNCSVANAYGSDFALIELMPHKTFPVLLIVVGAVGSVVLLVIVATIAFLCRRQSKKKKPLPDGSHAIEKQCKESDRSSNISDLKLELRASSSNSNVHCGELEYGGCGGGGGGSETGSESVVTRIGVPLAGPVALDGGGYRYAAAPAADYPEPAFPPKDAAGGQNNNGYVPYVDYSRDYSPPEVAAALAARSPTLAELAAANGGVDPRFSAAYGNPYLRGAANTARPAATPAPPPYSRAGHAPPGAAPPPASAAAAYIVPAAKRPPTMATHV